jgi:hypothetical protein
MPADALPVPIGQPITGTVHLRREYRDPLGRALTGQATLTGTARTERDGAVILPVPVVLKIGAGVLEADLPPDTYKVQASLRTTDGERVDDTVTVTLL